MWMLDTDICSYILKRRPVSVKARQDCIEPSQLFLSSVVLAELHFGAARHSLGDRIRGDIQDFVDRLTVLPWDEQAAVAYGRIRANLERAGKCVGNMDMMIAAHALSNNAVLVTNNIRHFNHIMDLRLENSAEPVEAVSSRLQEDRACWPRP